MTKKVTMQQIADYVGVSKFVVSKALSGKGGVNESTKEKVIEAASQLGYFSKSSLSLRGLPQEAGSRHSVLVLMPNVRFQTKDSLYWGRILDGISSRLEAAGLGMVIIMEQSSDQLLQIINPAGVLGLIGVGQISSSLLLEVHHSGLPFVLVDHEDPLIPSDTIFVNNYDAMHRLVRYLIGSGHRRLQFVGDTAFSRSFYDRWAGFRGALEEHGLAVEPREGMILELQGYTQFQEQIRQALVRQQRERRLPTAFVCANDLIAADMLEVLQELGIRVPQDVSVSGFDNMEPAGGGAPAYLTTVHVPKEVLGARAVEKLLSRIEDARLPAEKLLITGEVLYRDSTGSITRQAHA